jgi:hypothetical protein
MLAEREQATANTIVPVLVAHHAPAPVLLNAADGNTTLPVAHNSPTLALLNAAPTTLPTNVARTVPASALAPDSGRFRMAVNFDKVQPFQGQPLVDQMSFETWLTTHARDVADIANDADCYILASKHLKGSAITMHLVV